MSSQNVSIKNTKISFNNEKQLVIIAGPCVIESESQAKKLAIEIKDICRKHQMPFIFKASYDKANRSSVGSFRGPGQKKGIQILKNIKKSVSVPVLTDVHSPAEASFAASVADIIQVPAFLSRQTDLILACGKTGKVVNVKKGQFLAPDDMIHVIKKLESVRNKNIVLTERGSSFGYHNLVVDFRSIQIMKQTGYPVVFDVTHSVQLPGGAKGVSGGQREFIPLLARAAVAAGIAGLFLEVHSCPRKAKSDGANSITPKELDQLLYELKAIDDIVKEC